MSTVIVGPLVRKHSGPVTQTNLFLGKQAQKKLGMEVMRSVRESKMSSANAETIYRIPNLYAPYVYICTVVVEKVFK